MNNKNTERVMKLALNISMILGITAIYTTGKQAKEAVSNFYKNKPIQ